MQNGRIFSIYIKSGQENDQKCTGHSIGEAVIQKGEPS